MNEQLLEQSSEVVSRDIPSARGDAQKELEELIAALSSRGKLIVAPSGCSKLVVCPAGQSGMHAADPHAVAEYFWGSRSYPHDVFLAAQSLCIAVQRARAQQKSDAPDEVQEAFLVACTAAAKFLAGTPVVVEGSPK